METQRLSFTKLETRLPMHRNVLQKRSIDLEFKEFQVLQVFSIESFTISKVPFCMEELCFVNHYSLAIRAPNSDSIIKESCCKYKDKYPSPTTLQL